MRLLWCLVATLLMALPAAAEDTSASWALRGEPKTYTPKTLYECIDGAADLFLSYDVQQLKHSEYTDPSGAKLATVDVYDMGTPLHAFGIFSSERPESVALATCLGQQGYVDSGLAAFWQDRFYVKVSAMSGAAEADLRVLATASEASLPCFTGLPAQLRRLPAANRVANSERYTRQSALGHRFLQEVVSASYRVGKTTAEVHIADLGSCTSAAQGWRKLRDFEAKAGKRLAAAKGVGEEAFAVTDGSFGEFLAARKGQWLIVAFSEKAPRAALASLVKGAAKGL